MVEKTLPRFKYRHEDAVPITVCTPSCGLVDLRDCFRDQGAAVLIRLFLFLWHFGASVLLVLSYSEMD